MHTDYANEVGNIADFDSRLVPGVDAPTVYWTEVTEITRLRLVTDPGFPCWDVSYCWGMTEVTDDSGTHEVACRVRLPFHQLPKGKKEGKSRLYGALISYARTDGLNLKSIGLFDAISKCW